MMMMACSLSCQWLIRTMMNCQAYHHRLVLNTIYLTRYFFMHAVQGRRCSTLHHLPHTQKIANYWRIYIGVYIFLRAAPFSLLVRLFHHLGLCKRSTHAKPKYAKASKYFYLWVRCSPSSSRTIIIMPWSCCKLVPAESRRMQIDAWMMLYVHASCSRIPTSSGWHPTWTSAHGHVCRPIITLTRVLYAAVHIGRRICIGQLKLKMNGWISL